MSLQRAAQFIKQRNPLIYFRVPFFHKELFGSSVPSNILQLMYLLGSEKNMPHFEAADIPEHCVCHVPIKRFSNIAVAPLKVTKAMNNYPWFELAKSLQEEGFRVPVIAELYSSGNYVAIEGKHRAAAASLIEPYNSNYLIPCLTVVRDIEYSVKMFKKPHPDPLSGTGFRTFDRY